MLPEQWQQIKPVVQAALELEPGERSSYVTNTLGGDRELIHEAESLLRTYEDLGDFIEQPIFVGRIEVQAPGDGEHWQGRRLGPYEIVREVGRGGMGAVYLAKDLRLGRNVAIKLLPGGISSRSQLLRRFQREARSISQLNHPGIITIHEIEKAGDDDFIVTEFVEGMTLRQRLTTGRLETNEALDICLQTASALAAAHAGGIVHRDIKPENIMIRRDGLVKVLDFGIAKLVEQAGETPEEPTLTGVERLFPIGTPRYMSPEQMRAQEVDRRTDIWSLGCVLQEMLTGSAPFHGETTSDVIAAVLEREPASLPAGLDGALRRVIERSLMKDREDRYQSIEEMAADLRSAVRDVGSRTHIEETITPVRFTVLTAVSVAVLVIVGLVLFVMLKNDTSTVTEGVAGAPSVQRLTNDPGSDSYAQYTPDGNRIVFVSNRDGGEPEIYAMNADGSAPTRLTHNSVPDQHPSISPDGSRIVFSSKRGERNNLFVMSIDGAHELQVTESIDAYHPSWSPDGTRILFRRAEIKANDIPDAIDDGRESNLCLINPDGSRMQCLPSIGTWDNTPSWSPDGSQIVFSSKRDATPETAENAEIYLMQVDGTMVRRLTNLPNSLDVLPKFSPDGTSIVFTSITNGSATLYSMRMDGSQLEPLSCIEDSGSSETPSWSPDGRRILVSHNNWGAEADIYSVTAPANTIFIKRITSNAATDMMPDISADGSTVAFVSNRDGTNRIYLMNADGTGVRRLLADRPYSELSPAWAPNGKSLAFEHTGSGALQIYVVDVDGSNMRQISNQPGGCGRAAWSPDSLWLAFQCGPHPETDIYIARADGSEIFPITSDKYFDGDPTWSPDGSHLAFTSGRELIEGIAGIFIINRDGSGMRQLTDIPGFNSTADWSPDGKRLVFKSNRDGNFELYLIDVEGGTLERITNHVATDGEPEWSPDGRSIVFDSRRDGNREIHILKFGP